MKSIYFNLHIDSFVDIYLICLCQKQGIVNCRILHVAQLFVSGLPIATVKVVNCSLYFVKSIVKPRKSIFPSQHGDVKVALLCRKNHEEFLEDEQTLMRVLFPWRYSTMIGCFRLFCNSVRYQKNVQSFYAKLVCFAVKYDWIHFRIWRLWLPRLL